MYFCEYMYRIAFPYSWRRAGFDVGKMEEAEAFSVLAFGLMYQLMHLCFKRGKMEWGARCLIIRFNDLAVGRVWLEIGLRDTMSDENTSR